MGNINWFMVTYIFACIMIGATGTYLLASTSRPIGAFTFLIGAVIIFTIFGLRWFKYGTNKFAPTQWPPVINTCPDYLVFYERTVGGVKKPTCIDVLGVSTKPDVLNKWSNDTTAQNSDKAYFSLEWTKTGKEKLVEMCERTIASGLTWEGISNGESCYAFTSSSDIAAAAGAGCPAPAPAPAPAPGGA